MALFGRRSFRGDIVFTFAVAAVGYLAWLVRGTLVLLYVSALFAVVLAPVVRATSRVRVGRFEPFKGAVAILFLLLALAGAMVAYGYLAFPPVIHDLEKLSGEIPTRVPEFVAKLKHAPFFKKIPFVNRINAGELSAKIQQLASSAATYLLLSLKSLAGELVDVVMGFILTVYFLLDGDRAYNWFLSYFPTERRARLDDALQRARVRMERWLLGQGSLMLILGAASTIVYAALHIRYAYALGVLTGLLNVVPVLGSAVSLALALIVAATDSWSRVLGVAIFYAAYLQIENSYLTPRIMQSRVKLPGLAVIVALLLGLSLAGIIGAMVSVPTAVLVAVLLDEYLIHKDPE